MPPALVLDANAALHAKHLASRGHDPMFVLDRLAGAGARFVMTPKVQGEQVGMSLRQHHERWGTNGWMRIESTSIRDRKEVENTLRGRDKPDAPDVGLVALARRLGGVLYTHDAKAARLAQRCEVLAVDVADLGAFAVHRGWAAWPEVEIGFVGLRTFAWQPDDWMGTVEATVMSRPSRERLLTRLSAWLETA